MGDTQLKYYDSRNFKKAYREDPEVAKKAAIRKNFIADEVKTTDDGESREASFVISTATVDRDKDSINPEGFNLENYKRNPVVLFAHDNSRPPIGRAKDLFVEDGKLKATAEFMGSDIDTSGFSDMIFRMIKNGFLKATSVGFQPIDFDFVEPDSDKEGADTDRIGGIDFNKQELLEFSIVPVPANPDALIEARSKGIDVSPLEGWFEEALDNWMEYKDMLLVPRKKVERLYKAASGSSKSYQLSEEEKDELMKRNLESIKSSNKETEEEPEVETSEEQESEEVNKGDGSMHGGGDGRETGCEDEDKGEEESEEKSLEDVLEALSGVKDTVDTLAEKFSVIEQDVEELKSSVFEKGSYSDDEDEDDKTHSHGGDDDRHTGSEDEDKASKGNALASLLVTRLDARKDELGKSREDMISEISQNAGVSEGRVEAIMNGEENCPDAELVRTFADILQTDHDDLTTAMLEDGCEVQESTTVPGKKSKDSSEDGVEEGELTKTLSEIRDLLKDLRDTQQKDTSSDEPVLVLDEEEKSSEEEEEDDEDDLGLDDEEVKEVVQEVLKSEINKLKGKLD